MHVLQAIGWSTQQDSLVQKFQSTYRNKIRLSATYIHDETGKPMHGSIHFDEQSNLFE